MVDFKQQSASLNHLNHCGETKHFSVPQVCSYTGGRPNCVLKKSITFSTERWSCRRTQPCQPGSRRGAVGTPHCRSSSLCRSNHRIRRSTAGNPVEVKHKTRSYSCSLGNMTQWSTRRAPCLHIDVPGRTGTGYNTFLVFYLVFLLCFTSFRGYGRVSQSSIMEH